MFNNKLFKKKHEKWPELQSTVYKEEKSYLKKKKPFELQCTVHKKKVLKKSLLCLNVYSLAIAILSSNYQCKFFILFMMGVEQYN